MTIEQLQANIKTAMEQVTAAEKALADFEALPENNRFDSIEAAGALEKVLRKLAYEDCKGAYNCGDEFYEQQFMVGDIVYTARLDVEYSRHDKTYYYIDGTKFTINGA